MDECRRIEEKLPAYADGELSGDELQQVRLHVDECSECKELCSSLQQTWEVLGEWEGLEPGPNLRAGVWEKIRTQPQPARWNVWRWLSPLALSLAALAVVVGLQRGGPAPAPPAEPPVAAASAVQTQQDEEKIASLAPEWNLEDGGGMFTPDNIDEASHLDAPGHEHHLEPLDLGVWIGEDWLDASHLALDEELSIREVQSPAL